MNKSISQKSFSCLTLTILFLPCTNIVERKNFGIKGTRMNIIGGFRNIVKQLHSCPVIGVYICTVHTHTHSVIKVNTRWCMFPEKLSSTTQVFTHRDYCGKTDCCLWNVTRQQGNTGHYFREYVSSAHVLKAAGIHVSKWWWRQAQFSHVKLQYMPNIT